MVSANDIIEFYLKLQGLSQDDVDYLMARYLEEEAFLYVECYNLVEKD